MVVNRVASFADDAGSASPGYKEVITVRVGSDERNLSPPQQHVLHYLAQSSPDHEDAFELRSGERTRVYVAKVRLGPSLCALLTCRAMQKAKTSKSLEVGSPSTKWTNVRGLDEPHENPPDTHGALEQRPGPVDARSTVLKRGDRQLDVDIPPVGCCPGESVGFRRAVGTDSIPLTVFRIRGASHMFRLPLAWSPSCVLRRCSRRDHPGAEST